MVVDVNQPIYRQVHAIEQCPLLKESAADIDAVSTYPTFDFQVSVFIFKVFLNKDALVASRLKRVYGEYSMIFIVYK